MERDARIYFETRAEGCAPPETKWILKHAAANHDTVEAGKLVHQLQTVFSVCNITIDSQKRVRGDFVTQGDDIWDELEVGWDFAHFFFGAQVDGQVDDVLLKQSCEPVAPLVNMRVAEASFDTDGKSSGFGRFDGRDSHVGLADER